MELGIKQLVSVALVVIVGMMLVAVTNDIKISISDSLTATVESFDIPFDVDEG